ncbi:MAG TPA: polyketide cyclase, partial [Thermoanaerobaculia bacterium]|nr:polyketide cyclase [Thermoanaerobaculia bacterium]
MALNDYHFATDWRVRGTVAEVLEILGDPLDLPRWWPAVYLGVTKLQDGTFDLHTKGFLPYTLRWRFRVTEQRADGFALDAFGDFVGHGDWRLTQEGDEVKIVYDWRI